MNDENQGRLPVNQTNPTVPVEAATEGKWTVRQVHMKEPAYWVLVIGGKDFHHPTALGPALFPELIAKAIAAAHNASLAVAESVEAEAGKALGKTEADVNAGDPTRQKKRIVWADGFCPECSEYCRPLTLALGEEGVPTGAKNWPATWGVGKIKQLHDFHYALNRLMNALGDGNHEMIDSAKRDVEFYREFHRRQYRARLERHQREAASVELGGGSPGISISSPNPLSSPSNVAGES